MKIIEKPWGQEEILETNYNYTIKRLTMFAGHRCSLQYHRVKQETIYVLSGILFIHYTKKDLIYVEPQDMNIIEINKGESFTIENNKIHRMEAKHKKCVYLECSTSQLDDVVRIEDDYNRK